MNRLADLALALALVASALVVALTMPLPAAAPTAALQDSTAVPAAASAPQRSPAQLA